MTTKCGIHGDDTSSGRCATCDSGKHAPTKFGLPYAHADVDDEGYHVVCPVCGLKCRAQTNASEDAATKGATLTYQRHYADAAKAESVPRRYWRQCDDDATEELTEEQYRSLAEGNVVDVQVAVEAGFRTAFASYWTTT